MKNRFYGKKNAMTMAEIMIVVVIVAIVTAVFLAMPKKNVSQMDRAKYYAAYNMLDSMQKAQLANTQNTEIGANFCQNVVNQWLNTVASVNCVRDNSTTLTNGMVIDWSAAAAGNCRTVTVDIDGANAGDGEANKDVHSFQICNDGSVVPQGVAQQNTTDWISFKVYSFDANGQPQLFVPAGGTFRLNYTQAIGRMNNNAFCSDNRCIMEALPPLK